MGTSIRGLLVALLGTLLIPSTGLANGGTLRLANVQMGDYRVSVFTEPTPVRPDTLDVSVLVLQEGREGVAEGVEVWVRTVPLEGQGTPRDIRATREAADDPRYRAAKFGLGAEGRWRIEVEVAGEAGSGVASFDVTARERGLLGHPVTLLLLALLPLAVATWWMFREEAPHGEEGGADDPGEVRPAKASPRPSGPPQPRR